jgi:hypothetical protein
MLIAIALGFRAFLALADSLGADTRKLGPSSRAQSSKRASGEGVSRDFIATYARDLQHTEPAQAPPRSPGASRKSTAS